MLGIKIIALNNVLIPGISAKKIKPNKDEKMNSKYLNGANWETVAKLKALNSKYCIRFPPIPKIKSIKNSNFVGNCQFMYAGMELKKVVTKEKYKSIVNLFSVAIIFFIITSCNANKIAAKIGIKHIHSKDTSQFFCEMVAIQSPKKPEIVASQRGKETRSFKRNIEKINVNNGMVQQIITTSTRGNLIIEKTKANMLTKPNNPRSKFKDNIFVDNN